jgi:hypothetical protein
MKAKYFAACETAKTAVWLTCKIVGIHYKCQQDTHNRLVAETKGVAEPTVCDAARQMQNVIDARSSSVF